MGDYKGRTIAAAAGLVLGELDKALEILNDVDSRPGFAGRIAAAERCVAEADLHLAAIAQGEALQSLRDVSGTRLAAENLALARDGAAPALLTAVRAETGDAILAGINLARQKCSRWLFTLCTGREPGGHATATPFPSVPLVDVEAELCGACKGTGLGPQLQHNGSVGLTECGACNGSGEDQPEASGPSDAERVSFREMLFRAVTAVDADIKAAPRGQSAKYLERLAAHAELWLRSKSIESRAKLIAAIWQIVACGFECTEGGAK